MILILIFFFFLPCLLIESHKLHLQLLEYGHPSNNLRTGKSCDMNQSLCDPTFVICLKTSRSMSSCNLIQTNTPHGHYLDVSHIMFEKKIGEIENLFTASVPANQPITAQPYLVIRVLDDGNDYKPIVSFTAFLKEAGEYGLTSSHSSYMNVRYWFTCSSNWYGPTCNEPCTPMRTTGNHFGCNTKTGEQICEKGYKRSSTKQMICEKDPCLLNPPCKFLSECHVVPPNEVDSRSYRCHCSLHLKGRHCEDVRNPCPINNCLNGGKCWLDAKNVSHCQCPAQFLGEFCEKHAHIDEESMNNHCNIKNESNAWCLNKGKCIPKPLVGSNLCFCPRGFGGERCELNVTWISAYDEMTLWNDLTRKYSDTSLLSRIESKTLTPLRNRGMNQNSGYMNVAPDPPLSSLLSIQQLHDPSNLAIIQGLSSDPVVVKQGHFSIKSLHFGLIVLALACLAAVVLGVGLIYFCRRKNHSGLLSFTEDIPPELRESCRPVVYTPCQSATETRVNSTSLPYMWNTNDEYHYMPPDTVYEIIDHD